MVVKRIRTDESDIYRNVINTPDLIWDIDEGVADLVIDTGNADLKRQAALETAVIIALFTDKRADASDSFLNGTDPAADPRGWPGDFFEDQEVGSHLWLLFEQTISLDVLRRFKEYAEQALQVLIDQGVVARYNVEVQRNASNTERVDMSVVLFSSDGSQKYNRRFEVVWGQIYGF